MTTKAKPKFYFNNIKFNSIYYDTEIDDNIPRPINQSTASLNNVLTLTNLSPIQTSWTVPATVITNYVNFNSVNSNLISNVSGTPYIINSISMSGLLSCIGISNSGTLSSTNTTITGTIGVSGLSSLNGGVNAASALIQTTGEIKGRLLTIQNNTPTTTATISNAGLLTCIGISNTGTLSSTNTTITGTIGVSGLSTLTGGVNAVSALIQTTGEVKSRLLTIQNATPITTASISTAGLLTCIGISNSGTLSSTNTTITGTIGVSGLSTLTGGVNAVSALIQTTGEVKSRLLTIQNATPITTASISTAGLLTCIGISNSGTLSSTNTTITGTIGVSGLSSLNGGISTNSISNSGTLSSTNTTITGTIGVSGLSSLNGGITTNNNTINSGTGSISGGALSCTTLTSSTLNGLTCQGLIVKNGTTTNASLSNLGVLTCKAIQNNGNTLGCGNITCARIDTTNNQIDCGTGTVFAGIFSASGDSVLNSGTSSSKISIGSNQGSGSIDIGMNGGRSGDINIGYPTVSGSINIGRPIRMPGLVYTNSSEIGYSQNTTVTYSTSTGNGTESGIRKITTLPVLINNANYLINYSLQIDPLANFNATKLQFGIYRTTIFTDPIPNLSQNLHMLSGSTGANSTRYITAELYCYSGSGFLKYNSISTYSFSHILTFTGTVPTIIVNIDIIRIS